MMSVDKMLVREGDILAEGVSSIPKYTVITEELKVKLSSLDCNRVLLVSTKELQDIVMQSNFLKVQLASYLLSYISLTSISDYALKQQAIMRVYNEMLKDHNLIKTFAIMQRDNESLLVHSLNVGVYCALLTDDSEVIRGCLYHDVGKLSTPYCILNKRGSLDKSEIEIITKHTRHGIAFLQYETSEVVKDIVLHHHEKLDGSGYPDGVVNVSNGAKICAVCDMYDAITSKRCYKVSKSMKDAFKILFEDCDAGKLDRGIVKKLREKMLLYSIGSLVELSDGNLGVITSRLSSDSFIVCTEYGEYISDVTSSSIRAIV